MKKRSERCSYLLVCSVFFLVINAALGTETDNNWLVIDGQSDVCWQRDVEIRGNVSLSASCIAQGGVHIRESNVHLNCNGGEINLDDKVRTGIEIDSGGKVVENISIRNCIIRNSKFQGIYIGWLAPDRSKARALTKDQLYKFTPHNILIENVNILTPGSSGVYIDDFSSNVNLVNIEVSDARAMAIYFEHSSRDNVLKNSRIYRNGKGFKREAVSIDSSSNNVILNNEFLGNSFGAIFVYRNCSEHYQRSPDQVVRWMSSDGNSISGNHISGSRNAIWLASRQSMPLQNAECGNGYYAEGKYTEDSAKHNVVSDNKIYDSEFGVLVEDDFNFVKNNEFYDIGDTAIRVGTPIRNRYLNKPVIGIVVTGNVQDGNPVDAIFKWGSFRD